MYGRGLRMQDSYSVMNASVTYACADPSLIGRWRQTPLNPYSSGSPSCMLARKSVQVLRKYDIPVE